MAWQPVPVPVPRAALSLLLLTATCSRPRVNTTPPVPPGLLDTQMPPSDISAYLYVSEGSPLTVPLERFVDLAHIRGNADYLGIPGTLNCHRFAIEVGTGIDYFASVIKFSSELHAQTTGDILSKRSEVRR